jgi:hypothetical protein
LTVIELRESEHPAIWDEQVPGEGDEIVERSEKPGVARHAAERVGIAIVHLTPHQPRREPLVPVKLGRGRFTCHLE